VIYVIWNDAAAYAKWVGKRYPWGDEIDMIKLKLTVAIGMMETEQPKW
jgi:hypothetical protein|tara:strand:+ start:178 stop:321 length:144 start_codon:yes stop_codon:yes gene_type:complete